MVSLIFNLFWFVAWHVACIRINDPCGAIVVPKSRTKTNNCRVILFGKTIITRFILHIPYPIDHKLHRYTYLVLLEVCHPLPRYNPLRQTSRTVLHPMPTYLNQLGLQSSLLSHCSPSVKRPVTHPLHFGELGQLKNGIC